MKYSVYPLSVLVAATALVTTGCASIVSDSQYPVSIQSSPTDARFTIKDEMGRVLHAGRTPLTVTLDASDGYFSKAHYTVEFTYKGKTTTTYVTPDIDGWYFGNILLGGLIGMLIVDPATGAMYKLPPVVNATVDSDASLTVTTIDKLSEEQKKNLVKLNDQ